MPQLIEPEIAGRINKPVDLCVVPASLGDIPLCVQTKQDLRGVSWSVQNNRRGYTETARGYCIYCGQHKTICRL